MTRKTALVLALVGCGSGSGVVITRISPDGSECGVYYSQPSRELTPVLSRTLFDKDWTVEDTVEDCCTGLGGTLAGWSVDKEADCLLPICVY